MIKPLACNSVIVVMKDGVAMRYHPGYKYYREGRCHVTVQPSYYPDNCDAPKLKED